MFAISDAPASAAPRAPAGPGSPHAPAKRGWARLLEPVVVFPAIAAIGLVLIWSTALYLNRGELAVAQSAVAVAARQQANTYEAQVVRALQEIDQTLKVVKYAYEKKGRRAALQELKGRALLPPDLLFVVSIADAKGDIVASTRPPAMANIADQDYFIRDRSSGSMITGRPRQGKSPEDWRIEFARPLGDADQAFSGFALVSVDAAYFVASYDTARLGERGLMALLGTDGVFRARRIGERVSAGGRLPYASVVSPQADTGAAAQLSIDPWDGVQRYSTARELYDFPLAIVVGLSADEHLAPVRASMRTNLWAAAGASVLLLLTLAALARMSRQLAATRRIAAEGQAAYALQVEYLAYHDGLTMLPNRGFFSRLLAQAIGQAQRNQTRLALLFLDLDRFKHVNDSLGHAAGDEALLQVAVRLKGCLRDSDTVARLGGDEFVVLLQGLSEDRYAAVVAEKILYAVADPFVLAGQEVGMTASVGISIYPDDGLDEQALKKNADVAMYRAKEDGKNNFRFYSEEMNAHALERLSLESELRGALAREEFRLHYQPRRLVQGGRITAVEVLLRWTHPRLGDVAPAQMVPAAQEAGLMVRIGYWVLRAACRQNMAWQRAGIPAVGITVNLAPRQFFDPGLLGELVQVLRESGMEAALLELEVGEAVLMGDFEKAGRVIAGIRALGVRVSIDDFGARYAALSAGDGPPLDVVKIDRAYVRDAHGAAADVALTAAIVSLAHTLSPVVVAQGVETKEQADRVSRGECDEIQGFHLGEPMSAERMTEQLRAQPSVALRAPGPP